MGDIRARTSQTKSRPSFPFHTILGLPSCASTANPWSRQGPRRTFAPPSSAASNRPTEGQVRRVRSANSRDDLPFCPRRCTACSGQRATNKVVPHNVPRVDPEQKIEIGTSYPPELPKMLVMTSGSKGSPGSGCLIPTGKLYHSRVSPCDATHPGAFWEDSLDALCRTPTRKHSRGG